ncbi:MAG: DNA-binding domain-containing protein [Betaproteobacteria bacterium]|nr:DNA-binding domain-containing protein [Betaproteobacteria bacterium]
MITGNASGALTRFQDGFALALFDVTKPQHADIAALTAQPAFAVYRNTVMKGCIDALQANYPAVARLVGDEWFRAAAAIYVRATLPQRSTLLYYGEDFADFLARFEPAAELPYLPGAARLDRCWTEAHAAADDTLLDAGDIDALAAGNFFRLGLRVHSAARWAWFDDAPAYTIWSRNRSDQNFDGDIDWHGEGALLTRPHDAVQWVGLDRAGCAFLDSCAAGGTVADAAKTALGFDPHADLAQLISVLLQAGAFSRLDRHD